MRPLGCFLHIRIVPAKSKRAKEKSMREYPQNARLLRYILANVISGHFKDSNSSYPVKSEGHG